MWTEGYLEFPEVLKMDNFRHQSRTQDQLLSVILQDSKIVRLDLATWPWNFVCPSHNAILTACRGPGLRGMRR